MSDKEKMITTKSETIKMIDCLITQYLRDERSRTLIASDLGDIKRDIEKLAISPEILKGLLDELNIMFDFVNSQIKFYNYHQHEHVINMTLNMDQAKYIRNVLGSAIRILNYED